MLSPLLSTFSRLLASKNRYSQYVRALAAGWWVDRSSLARRDAEWEKQFGQAMRILSKESGNGQFFDTPGGPYTVNRRPDPENEK